MQLKAFDLAEVTGWFKPSSERIYAATGPIAEFEVPLSLEAGMHKIEVPEELRNVDELIVSTSYAAKSTDDPAFALYGAWEEGLAACFYGAGALVRS